MLRVKAVKGLGQVIHIIGNQRRRIFSRSGLYYLAVIFQQEDQFQLFVIQLFHLFRCRKNAPARFPEDRTDTCVCVLDKRPRVPLEVDRLRRVKKHSLFGFHLQQVVFQGAQGHHPVKLFQLLIRKPFGFALLFRDGFRSGDHLLHQLIGIYHGALT
ncbi:hypothetical protein FQZ97_891640 [compost metagenome]